MHKIPVDYDLPGARRSQLRMTGLLKQERQGTKLGVYLVGCSEACGDFEETNGSTSVLMLLASHIATVVSQPLSLTSADVLMSFPHSRSVLASATCGDFAAFGVWVEDWLALVTALPKQYKVVSFQA